MTGKESKAYHQLPQLSPTILKGQSPNQRRGLLSPDGPENLLPAVGPMLPDAWDSRDCGWVSYESEGAMCEPDLLLP